jgi:hypothetical protein
MLVRQWAGISNGNSLRQLVDGRVERSPQARRGSAENRRLAVLKHHRPCGRPPFECIALLRQGGGAGGAIKEACTKTWSEAGLHPAGPPDFNRRHQRRPACRQSARGMTRQFSVFWEFVTLPFRPMAVSAPNVAPRGRRRCAAPADAAHPIPKVARVVAELLEVNEPIDKRLHA